MSLHLHWHVAWLNTMLQHWMDKFMQLSNTAAWPIDDQFRAAVSSALLLLQSEHPFPLVRSSSLQRLQ